MRSDLGMCGVHKEGDGVLCRTLDEWLRDGRASHTHKFTNGQCNESDARRANVNELPKRRATAEPENYERTDE